MMRVVFDTSVLVAAVRSTRGASFALVNSVPSKAFQICLSVALFSEWQEVLTRPEHLAPGKTVAEALNFVGYIAQHSWLQEIHFLWRPFLRDPDDDMILELAINAQCPYIVTHNTRDFAGCEQFGIAAITPRDFLRQITGYSKP